MSISSRIEQIEQHLTDDYSVLEVAGADLTNIDKNIVNLKPTWQERLLYFMDNGTEEVWNNWNKATGEGTSISLNNTLEAKMKIELKGNTYQEGTPTPDTPQEVQTVTGDNEIKVEGKNLFNPTYEVETQYTTSGIASDTQYVLNDNVISCDKSNYSNGARFFNILELEAGTYTWSLDVSQSGNTTQVGRKRIRDFDNDTDLINSGIDVSSGKFSQTFTINSKTKIGLMLKPSSNTDGTFLMSNIQLEKGSTATEFEEYKSQTYEINLGKNLLNMTNGTYTSATGITAVVENGKITLNGTATANSFLAIPFVYEYNGTYTISANNEETIGSTTASGTYASVRINGNTDTQAIMGSKNATITFTLNQKYNDFTIRTGQGLTYDNFVIYPQLEKGSQATSYSAYKTPIELCKIGDYQDSIRKGTGKNLFDSSLMGEWSQAIRYIPVSIEPNTNYTLSTSNPGLDTYSANVFLSTSNSGVSSNTNGVWANRPRTINSGNNNVLYVAYRGNIDDKTNYWYQLEKGTSQTEFEPYVYKDKWYINKQIGKVVLDGSENWNRGSSVTTRSVYVLDTFTDRLSSNNRDDFYSDNFSYLGNAQLTDLGYAMSFNSGQYSNYIYIQVPLNVVAYDHVTDFKTWLSTHNTEVYYVLATPTTTEITDSELLSQLEALLGARSYEGQTNINQENSNLASVLNASALQEM